MSKWVTIEKEGTTVKMGDAQIAVGQKLSMGLGSIELRKTEKAGLHIVRLSQKGHFKYSLKLVRDGRYRLGSARGHRIVPPNEEMDPIKRVLREMEIPISKLSRQREGEVLQIETSYGQLWPAGNSMGNTIYLTDGLIKTEVTSFENCIERGDIFNASYALKIDHALRANSMFDQIISQVHTWPGCDPSVLSDAIATFRLNKTKG